MIKYFIKNINKKVVFESTDYCKTLEVYQQLHQNANDYYITTNWKINK